MTLEQYRSTRRWQVAKARELREVLRSTRHQTYPGLRLHLERRLRQVQRGMLAARLKRPQTIP